MAKMNSTRLLFTLLLTSCTQASGSDTAMYCSVRSDGQEYCAAPLVALLANPRDWDGRYVLAVGVGEFSALGCNLYLSEDAWRAGADLSAIRLRFEVGRCEDFAPWSGRYMEILGTFDAKLIGAYTGTIRVQEEPRPLPDYRKGAETGPGPIPEPEHPRDP